MKRRVRPWVGVACLASALAGCDYSAPEPRTNLPSGWAYQPDPIQAPDSEGRKGAILANVMSLIRTAALRPGGANFGLAAENLNQYFADTDSTLFALSPEARSFLLGQLPEAEVKGLEAREFTLRDARHLEDCMLYRTIATRVAGTGDDLSRARRVFDWMVRNIQLVPAGSLGAPGLGQAQARPYDVLLRGMATEEGGLWSERGWLFLSLCRQLGIDVGLVTYTPAGRKDPIAWLCAALIDKKLYLFDPRIGLPVPGPDGQGVATLDQALADPVVLDRLDLPGQSPYLTSASALAASPSKIGILIDSGPGYLAPRMHLLEKDLAGKDSTILYRDPVDQRDKFVAALGPHSGGVTLWALPWQVDRLLFSNPQFVQATQQSLMFFDPKLPLVYARIKQLRGEYPEAIQEYMGFSFVEQPTLRDKRTPMSPLAQQAIDVYATYDLALCHLDQDNPKQAEFFFKKILRLLPEYGPGQPFLTMFRWGAQANLARLSEAQGNPSLAIAFYAQRDLTTQRHGNLVRARELAWRDPMAPPPASLPPPPTHPAPAAVSPTPAPIAPEGLAAKGESPEGEPEVRDPTEDFRRPNEKW